MIFCKTDCIFILNFFTSKIEVIHKFEDPLLKQPQFFNSNDEQTKFVCASPMDGIYVDIITRKEHDIDNEYNISNISEVIFDHEDRCFYILANKY